MINKMNIQTSQLFAVRPPNTAAHAADLLASYTATTPDTVINYDLYAEPYYGDYKKCSVVVLTHNPGGSDVISKGIGSAFEKQIYANPNNPELNYFSMASGPQFPNNNTNNWANKWNTEMHNHFDGIQNFNNKVFIRDLIPYHSSRFGLIDMTKCSDYLYNYFFNQIIEASFNSELYSRINSKNIKLATIIYARGTAWKDEQGLGAIGWDRIGSIYKYCYVYKANFDKILREQKFKQENYPESTLAHDVYIVVITAVRIGVRYGIYSKFRDQKSLTDLKTVVINYRNITNQEDALYIKHNTEMDLFIETIK